jgi:predicted amidohydrolase
VDVSDGDPDTNLARALDAVSAEGPAHLTVLPELWTSGYAHGEWTRIASIDTPRIVDRLLEKARTTGSWIAGSMIHQEDGRLFNRLSFLGPDGQRVHYDKVHLFGPMGEVERLTPGEARGALEIAGWKAAPSICFDLRFPEMYRLDALDGAILYVVVAAWPAVRREAFRILCRARALENQAFLVFCNRSGRGADGTLFAGSSLVVDPEGRVIAELGSTPGILTAELDPGALGAARSPPTISLRHPRVDVVPPPEPGADAPHAYSSEA